MADNFHTYVSNLLRSLALIVLCYRLNRIFLLCFSIRFSQNTKHFRRDKDSRIEGLIKEGSSTRFHLQDLGSRQEDKSYQS